MRNDTNKIDELAEHVEAFIETQQELTKITIAEKLSVTVASLLSGLIIGTFLLLVFLFSSIALAYSLAAYFGKVYLGFLSVAALYFIIALLLMMMKESLLKTPIANTIIKNFFKHNSHE